MSLKARLSVAIMGLVTTVVVALSAMSITRVLDLTLDDLHERAVLNAVHLRDNLLSRIKDRSQSWDPPPGDFEETKRMWNRIVEQDPEVQRLIERAVINSGVAVEIYVADANGRVVASSDPTHRGSVAENLPRFAEWSHRTIVERLRELLFEHDNYLIQMPIGLQNQAKPVFVINVVVSSILIRNAVDPELRELGIAWAVSLLGSLAISVLFANVVLRPLGGISRTIDRIRRGDPEPETAGEGEAQEFADLRSKLGTLAREFLGARQDASDLRANVTQLIERSEEAVLLFGRDGRLRSAGAPAERLLGRSRRDMEGLPIAAIFPGSIPLGADIHEAVRSRRPFHNRSFLFDRAGRAGRLLVSVEFLDDHPVSRETATMVTLRDAESRRQLVSHLADISNRMAAIRRLTGGVAHEMKNPLNAIGLELEVLRSKLAAGAASENIMTEIDLIEREVLRLDRVIKTFLEFTQPVELQLKQLPLAELVTEVIEIERPIASGRGAAISVRDESGGARILVDASLVRQAVQNILSNGLDATKPGGTVRVDLERASGEVVLSIADQGPGIAPDIRDRVFDLYFTTKKDGAGIGLAVAAQVVQLHGGSIECLSDPGHGSTFRLRFPNAEMREAMEAQ